MNKYKGWDIDNKASKDRYTRNKLIQTLKRFGVIKEEPKSFQTILEDMQKTVLDNFGTAGSMYVSPKQLKQFKGLSEQLKKDSPN